MTLARKPGFNWFCHLFWHKWVNKPEAAATQLLRAFGYQVEQTERCARCGKLYPDVELPRRTK